MPSFPGLVPFRLDDDDESVALPLPLLDGVGFDDDIPALFRVFLLTGVASTSDVELMGEVDKDRKMLELSCSCGCSFTDNFWNRSGAVSTSCSAASVAFLRRAEVEALVRSADDMTSVASIGIGLLLCPRRRFGDALVNGAPSACV